MFGLLGFVTLTPALGLYSLPPPPLLGVPFSYQDLSYSSGQSCTQIVGENGCSISSPIINSSPMVVLDFAILFFPAFYLVLFLTRFGSSKWPLRGALVLFSLLTISSGVLAVYQGASLTYPTYGGVTNLEIIGNPILSPGTASTKTSRGTASFGIDIANYHSSDTGFSISLFGPVPKNDSNSLFGNISTVSSSYPRLQIYQCRDQSHCFSCQLRFVQLYRAKLYREIL